MNNNIANCHQVNLSGSKIVLTGGAGFIGSHLAHALLRRGVQHITVIDSLKYGDVSNLQNSPGVSVIQHALGIDRVERLEEAMRDHDFLFHLAAEKHNQSKDSPFEVLRANIDGSLEAFTAATKVGIRKIVYTSSLYAYGRLNGANFRETDLPAPRTIYGTTKLAGEHILEYISSQFGIPYSVIRYFFVYGPKQFAGMGYKSVIVKNYERLLRGQQPTVFGDGTQVLDYIYVDDAIEATIRAMEIDTEGHVINVGTGEGVSVNDLLSLMCRTVHLEFNPLYEAADWTAGTRRVGDIGNMKSLLGFSPQTQLVDGLSKTVEWLKSQEKEGACLVASSR